MHRSIDCPTVANDLEIDYSLTVVVVDIHAASNKTAEVFYVTDIISELLITAQKVLCGLGRLAITDRIERKANNSGNENENQQSDRSDDAKDYENEFAIGHQPASSGGSAVEVKASKIVDERRIEEQAIETIENTAMSRKNVCRVFSSSTALESAFS